VKIRSRRTVIAAALTTGLLLFAVTLTTRADAAPASPETVDSFRRMRESFRDFDEPLYGRFFQTAPWGGPYLTASGRGAFQFFDGSWNVGALYQPPWLGYPHPVYGSILDAWSAQGYEQGPWGYPDSRPYVTTIPDACPVGSLYQRFRPEQPVGFSYWNVCVEPDGRVTSHQRSA
jgi:hypothetical protein